MQEFYRTHIHTVVHRSQARICHRCTSTKVKINRATPVNSNMTYLVLQIKYYFQGGLNLKQAPYLALGSAP